MPAPHWQLACPCSRSPLAGTAKPPGGPLWTRNSTFAVKLEQFAQDLFAIAKEAADNKVAGIVG